MSQTGLDPKTVRDPEKDTRATKKGRWRLRWWHFGLVVALGLALLVGWIGVDIAKNEARQERYRAEQELKEKNKAPPWTYDPAACATDPEGMVYIALGRIVLRLPMEQSLMTDRLEPYWPERMISPPDPSEPEGCPGNPSQQRSLGFMYAYEAILKNKFDPNMTGRPNLLRLISAAPDAWGLQLSTEKRFEAQCRRRGERRKLPNGLTACHVQPDDKTIPIEHWGVTYRADPEVYSAPFGRPFVVDCWPGVRPELLECHVTYKLYETLNVAYRFWPKNIPIDQIIEFDSGLREKIAASRIVDFMWPDDAADQDRPHQ